MVSHPEQYIKGDLSIVGDIPETLSFFLPLLREQGYNVYHTTNLEQAIDRATVNPPHLIILSTALQEPDSYNSCQTLKKIATISHIPILFLIVENVAFDPWKIYKIGGADYLSHPFDEGEMLARIEQQVMLARLQKRLERQSNQLERSLEDLRKLETYMEEVYDELREFSFYDNLTKVANRRRFEEYLDKEWRRGARDRISWNDVHQTALSLIFCDLDYFMAYNDYLGLEAGDECLKKVAQAIQGVVKRPADLVARYSGKTFAILLPYTDSDGALQVANLMRLAIEQLKLPHPHSTVSEYVTLSFGVATGIPTNTLSSDILSRTAFEALQQAKYQGRNCIICDSV